MSLDCGADALMDFRRSLTDSGAQVSLNDLILKVTATTLKDVPALNSAWSDAGIRRFRSVDLAVAVAIEGGLITPVIRAADKKRIAEIAEEMRDLVSRARTGQLSREEYQGGTFTVSNMGMYGVDHFTAVINPPQAAILAVGAAGERPVVQNGVVTSANMMTCQPVSGSPCYRWRGGRRVSTNIQAIGGGSTSTTLVDIDAGYSILFVVTGVVAGTVRFESESFIFTASHQFYPPLGEIRFGIFGFTCHVDGRIGCGVVTGILELHRGETDPRI